MKLNSFTKHKFKADFYDYVVSTDAEGGEIRTYFFVRRIDLKIVTGYSSTLSIFLKDEDGDVVAGCQLENITDAGGRPFRENGVWLVDYAEPEINLWGLREGFRGRLAWVGVKS